METAHLPSQRRFDAAKMQKVPIFDSDKLFFDQYCLLPGQAQRIHRHAREDKIYVVLEGTAIVHVDGEEQALTAGQAAIARAGEAHGVRNETDEPAVLLAAMAPRPTHP